MNYVGVMPSAAQAANAARFDPPSPAAGYVSLRIGEVDGGEWLAASYASKPSDPKKVLSWPVEVHTDMPNQSVTLSWDNAQNLPAGYGAMLRTPEGQMIDLSKKSSANFASASSGVTLKAYTLYVGSAEALAAVLAAPLTKEMTFAYPNPGPDAAGNMTFGYNVAAAGAEVTLNIYDVGGKHVKEIKATSATAGANTLTWDTTNKNGQKLGSGVYIYILESSGNKLVDKFAIVR